MVNLYENKYLDKDRHVWITFLLEKFHLIDENSAEYQK